MEFFTGHDGRKLEIYTLFVATFTASEGDEEGRTVGALARDLMATTPEDDLLVCCVADGPLLTGCIMFSRMRYAEDERTVFLLSPVAVRTDRQGEGVGQALLRYGLDASTRAGVDAALTYGDPNYYGKVGFRPITPEVAAAPFDLSMPHGWQGQSLDGSVLTPLVGAPHCVEAFNRPELW